ncbi:hypothetical protein LDO26_14495 [Luteimonas sp. BDR2-5]|uniref:hypothetical protein n=1 Tax=Proluteimonas luteida TaxID=2878685 RepID=UPI001E2BBA28|nr:hypothetical protein [Luteimonas sp. BDR2-5]MCD9029401.1 hypothetical protein [Luteimonas sp. BDR2-5]
MNDGLAAPVLTGMERYLVDVYRALDERDRRELEVAMLRLRNGAAIDEAALQRIFGDARSRGVRREDYRAIGNH